ncbi:hypothetical protein BC831DRAFT_493118 [Entophlyctis helioformis]|nr:hypothetical protein BC831DRAFT_493118 [Entophlyctis helioformis]
MWVGMAAVAGMVAGCGVRIGEDATAQDRCEKDKLWRQTAAGAGQQEVPTGVCRKTGGPLLSNLNAGNPATHRRHARPSHPVLATGGHCAQYQGPSIQPAGRPALCRPSSSADVTERSILLVLLETGRCMASSQVAAIQPHRRQLLLYRLPSHEHPAPQRDQRGAHGGPCGRPASAASSHLRPAPLSDQWLQQPEKRPQKPSAREFACRPPVVGTAAAPQASVSAKPPCTRRPGRPFLGPSSAPSSVPSSAARHACGTPWPTCRRTAAIDPFVDVSLTHISRHSLC